MIQKIKKKLFLIKLNNRIKRFGAKAVFFQEREGADIIQVSMGKDFHHVGVANLTNHLIDSIESEVHKKFIKENFNHGLKIECSKGLKKC